MTIGGWELGQGEKEGHGHQHLAFLLCRASLLPACSLPRHVHGPRTFTCITGRSHRRFPCHHRALPSNMLLDVSAAPVDPLVPMQTQSCSAAFHSTLDYREEKRLLGITCPGLHAAALGSTGSRKKRLGYFSQAETDLGYFSLDLRLFYP